MAKAAQSDGHVRVGADGRRTVTAARDRVYIASKLGKPVSKVTAKIANAR